MKSSSIGKIARAVALGAKGGVDYTDKERWPKKLRALPPTNRPFFDAVIDDAGGDIVGSTFKLLKVGGVVVSYGMTSLVRPTLLVQAVMKNIESKGSTFGSRGKFRDMIRFVAQTKVRPVVEKVISWIDNLKRIEMLFENMKAGRQFGTVVVQIQNKM